MLITAAKQLRLPVIAALLCTSGCTASKTIHTQTVPDADYHAALEWSDPANYNLPPAGSPAEAAMLARVEALFTDYTYANLSAAIPQVYAETVYFRDAFKLLRRSAAIRAYFLEGLEVLEAAEFSFNQVVRSGGDFYIDWTMRLDFKKTPSGTWEESIGMSRMRFNSDGQVIFHQDYWDPTDIVYKRIPIAKQLIAYVKSKL